MKILCKFPTVNISKCIFLLVICIAVNFIWTTLKANISIFLHPQILDFQIVVSRPNIVHTSMERLFIQLSGDANYGCDIFENNVEFSYTD